MFSLSDNLDKSRMAVSSLACSFFDQVLLMDQWAMFGSFFNLIRPDLSPPSSRRTTHIRFNAHSAT